MEKGGERWSKPHVATLSLHSLFELRTCIEKGTIMLDMEASSLPQVVGKLINNTCSKQNTSKIQDIFFTRGYRMKQTPVDSDFEIKFLITLMHLSLDPLHILQRVFLFFMFLCVIQ